MYVRVELPDAVEFGYSDTILIPNVKIHENQGEIHASPSAGIVLINARIVSVLSAQKRPSCCCTIKHSRSVFSIRSGASG